MSWKEWLAERRAASGMQVNPIPLRDVSGWGMQKESARFGRADGKFFDLLGARVSVQKAGQREVASWDQPLLREVGEGAVVLVVQAGSAVLVAARAEPGNDAPGCVLLGPTIQASRSNLEQAHGGTRPPRAELLDNRQVHWYNLPQDGGRFLGKRNRYAVVALKAGELTDLRPDERWLAPWELDEAFLAGEVNEHLALAHLLMTLIRPLR